MPADIADSDCFHCGLLVTTGDRFSLEYQGQKKNLCCPGCKAVAQSIISSGMDNYYQYRTTPATLPEFEGEALSNQLLEELKVYDEPQLQQTFVYRQSDGSFEVTLSIEGITCAACVWLLDKKLAALPGVQTHSVNLTTHRAVISWWPDQCQLSDLLEAIYGLGYKAYPFSPTKEEQYQQSEGRTALRRLLLAGIGMMQVMMFSVPLYIGEWSGIAEEYKLLFRCSGLVMTTAVVFYSARPFFIAAWRDLRVWQLTMDIPVSLAIGIAYLASVWSTLNDGPEVYFDSVCMFTFFLLLGRFLEMRARHRTGDSGNRLMQLLPNSAIRLNGSEQEVVVTGQLCVGDRVLVKPGATIPADAVVEEGRSGVDEAALTGEGLPVHKEIGDMVIGGTLNIENPLTLSVTGVGQDMQVSMIVRLLERAKQEKPGITLLVNRLSSYFVLAVLLISGAVAAYWSFVSPDDAFWITLSVLVVTCPCALSLATPAALTAATGSLNAKKILLTKAHVLEALPQATHVVFDKTGTLTQGALSLSECEVLVCEKYGSRSEEECLALASALESFSEHPIARAFVSGSALNEKHRYIASDVKVESGKGLEGIVANQRLRIGTASYVSELGYSEIPSPKDSGQWILLGDEQHALCWFRLSDSLRNEALSCIRQLKARGLQVELLSGDPSSSAAELARQLGIETVISGASPEDKLKHIKTLQSSGASVVMAGDGINDGPVLAQSQVSIAVGCASDLARANADILLPGGELNHIPFLFDKAAKTQSIIKQNLSWALIYNLLALPLAIAGMIPPYLAAAGMSASSLVVVTNALRLSRDKRG